jgi:hypothetical protein
MAIAREQEEGGHHSAAPPHNVRPFAPSTEKAKAPVARWWRPALAAALVAAAIGSTFWLSRSTSSPIGMHAAQEVELTPEELARATVEVKLALAYLTQVGREAGVAVRDEMVANVVAPTHRALR